MNCPACGHANPEGAAFCNACGQRLGDERRPSAYAPEHLVDKIRAGQRRLAGEHKHVTVLFADVTGSMALAEAVDPETWQRIMDRFFALLCDGVHRFEGTVNAFTGDGIMALFGAPIAHEDHGRRACYAALYLRDELARYAAELRRERGLNFSVRMGLNSGEVVVGAIGEDLQLDYTAIGHTVGLAQRMEALAESGQAYLTEDTARVVEGFFAVRDLGTFALKGVSEPPRVFRLEGTGPLRTRLDVAGARGFSRFVGRRDEMAALEAALAAALDGEGTVVGIVGEPGVGKSRLCHELVEHCRARGSRSSRATASPTPSGSRCCRSSSSLGGGSASPSATPSRRRARRSRAGWCSSTTASTRTYRWSLIFWGCPILRVRCLAWIRRRASASCSPSRGGWSTRAPAASRPSSCSRMSTGSTRPARPIWRTSSRRSPARALWS
jgi:class 3 adenylate cyclase